MKKGRIYVAGPMSGMPGYNHAAFNAAAERLRADGWVVENPVDICARFGTVEQLESDPELFARVIAAELRIVSECDAIYLLNGWEKSIGARRELAEALKYARFGLKVLLEPPPVLGADAFGRFSEDVLGAVLHAETKHPHAGLEHIESWGSRNEAKLKELRILNDALERLHGKFSWYEILREEVYEAREAIAKGQWTSAQEELAQVACVAFRAWKWCGERKAAKEVE